MCGVVGFSCKDPIAEHYIVLQKIILQSKIRGLHSFGYTYNKDGRLITKKYHHIDKIELPKSKKLIFLFDELYRN